MLLFDVLPSFLTKLHLPYIIHKIPYHLRTSTLILPSFLGMQLVAYAPSLGWCMFDVALECVTSGIGEISFVGLTHYILSIYGQFALASWGVWQDW